MRVAVVCPYDLDTPGGVQTHVRQLTHHLREHDDDVALFAPGTAGDQYVPVGRPLPVKFNDSLAPIALAPRVPGRLLAGLRAYAPDVLHVHEPAVPWVSLAAALRGPRPAVGTFHAWSTRDRAYRLARPLAARAARRLDRRIGVSRAAITYHAGALGLPEGAFHEIPNGVDTDRFATARPIEELTGDGRPTLLFVGRLEHRKGCETLVRAFVALKARRPDLRLLVVGAGPDRDHCQTLLPAQLRSDALFFGPVDDTDLPRFYHSADVFVAPNLGGESFGMVLLEAMAAGRPVVASDLPGFRSVLRDGIEGRLVPPGDVGALATALETLLANPSLRKAMADEGRARAREYDWARVTQSVRATYLSMLD